MSMVRACRPDVPVVVRTTENMLRLVPGSLREAAFALGAPRWKVSTMVTLRAARSGVMTGLLLGILLSRTVTAIVHPSPNHDEECPRKLTVSRRICDKFTTRQRMPNS